MASAKKANPLIEFKGTTLPIVSVTLHSLHLAALTQAAADLFGNEVFFDGDAAVLELDRLEAASPAEGIDWVALRTLFERHGLHVIGVRGGSETLRANATAAGLPCFRAFKRASPAAGKPAPVATPTQEQPVQIDAPAQETPAKSRVPAVTLVIDRPLRSGQQAYARDGDLVVLAAVNAGAEVIADGSIHIYAPLRGRALAGASGSVDARIFTTRFEAELVSIAGVYRTFDNGIPGQLAGRPVQVQLDETGDGTSASSGLSITALNTD